jgi:hypothetical protein
VGAYLKLFLSYLSLFEAVHRLQCFVILVKARVNSLISNTDAHSGVTLHTLAKTANLTELKGRLSGYRAKTLKKAGGTPAFPGTAHGSHPFSAVTM